MTQTITVIRGDGIGPEIMDATLYVLDAMKVGLTYEDADAGEPVNPRQRARHIVFEEAAIESKRGSGLGGNGIGLAAETS